MKIILTARKPRNPLVAAARFRHAGAHRACGTAQRQQACRDLRQEVAALPRGKPSP